MPRGTGMSPTRRRNRRSQTMSPEALAARLPGELRSFRGYASPGDFHATAARIAAWLDTQAPGIAEGTTVPVMIAAGIGPSAWYRAALTTSDPTRVDQDERGSHALRS